MGKTDGGGGGGGERKEENLPNCARKDSQLIGLYHKTLKFPQCS